jgi:hypothetical protein
MAKAKKPAAKAKDAKTAQKERPKAVTIPKVVKVIGKEAGPKPLKKGDEYLFIKNGKEVYMTLSVAYAQFTRNPEMIVIPKGSEYVPPQGAECDGC